MPDQHKAESAIVRPRPATFEAIDQAILKMGDTANRAAEIFGSSPGSDYVGGLQGGLAIAIDHPEVIRDLLAAIDEGKRLHAIEQGAADPAGEVASDAEARVEFLRPLVDAANGVQQLPPSSTGEKFRWN